MSTQAGGPQADDPIGEVARRRDRMQSTLDELQRVVDLDDRGDGQWPDAAVAALAEATAMWDRHVAGTEAPQGVLADVVEREPRLTHFVNTLRADHGEIRALMGQADSTLSGPDPGAARSQVRSVAERLSRHHHLGGELIHLAYEVDIGGGG